MRRFFWAVAVWLAILALGQTSALGAQPRNVIFFIGDGMGPEQVKAATYYLGGPLSFESLPYQGWLTTYSANSSVTDSAAAATAMATGYKVNNGVISEARPANADYTVVGSEMQTLVEYFKAQGKSTGLVTTTYVTHATPAAFGAHTSDRNNLTDIAGDYLNQTRPNVLLGGGANGMSVSTATSAGYNVVTSRAAMQALDTETQTMVSGQFGSSYLPYEYDGLGALPHLSEMTTTALDILDNDPDGFFVMIEGGLIDQAGHSNDIRRNVRETVEFGNSVQRAIDWAAGRGDTLILVAADHETGGLLVTGNNGQGNYPSVSWSSGDHTAANVPVYAWGHGAELISGVMNNTQMFAVATADTAATLTWDGKGPGNWGDPRWTGYLPPGSSFPNGTTRARVQADTVTVAGDHAVLELTIQSGGLVIDPLGSLTAAGGVDVAAGAALHVAGTLHADTLTTAGANVVAHGGVVSVTGGVDVAASATLDVAGGLNAASLTTAGATSFAEGSLAAVDSIHVTGGTTTLSRLSFGAVNVTGGILNTAADVDTLKVDGGTVNTTAAASAAHLDVASGQVNLDGGDLHVATMQLTGGVVNTGPNRLVVSDTLRIGERANIGISGGTFQVSSPDLADPAVAENLTLSGGTLHIAGGTVAAPGAIALWKFEEGAGPVTADLSTAGNDHLGTLSGATWASGDPDHPTALRFDGSAYLGVANTGDVQLGNAFTIGMWINTSQKGVKLVGKGRGDHNWQPAEKALYVDQTNGQVTFTGRSCGTLRGTTNVADGRWHHVAVTFNAPGDQEVYVDGVKDTATRTYAGNADNGDVFRLGWAETRDSGGYLEYVGLMDDVYLYDRSLTAKEVADVYQAFSSVLQPLPNTNLRVTAASTLHLDTAAAEATLGDLTLDPHVALEITGAAAQFHDVAAGDGSSIEGNVRVGGILSPGGSPGTLSVIGNLTMPANSTYRWELASSAHDLTEIDSGTLLLERGWKLQLRALGGRAVGADQEFHLFTFGDGGSLNGGSDLAMDWAGAIELLGDDWNLGHEDWNPTLRSDATGIYISGLVAVPEPSTLVLLGMGALALVAGARRNGRRTKIDAAGGNNLPTPGRIACVA